MDDHTLLVIILVLQIIDLVQGGITWYRRP
jgi:hypothetical protein